jgi:hypothetical protein
VKFVCPGEVIIGTVWTHQCSRGTQIESDNTCQLIVNAPSQGGRGSSNKRIKRISQSRQSRSLLTTQWNNKSSNGNGKVGVRGYGHKRRPWSFEPTPSGTVVQNNAAQDIIIKNCNDGTCPSIILPANHPQCSGSNIHDIATVYKSTPVPAENQQAPPVYIIDSPSLDPFPNAPIPPTVMVNAPVPAPSQPIVSMQISNSVPTHANPFSPRTRTPSQGGNNPDPPFPETLGPSFEPAEIQGAPLVYITDSPSLDPFPNAPIPPTVMVNAPVAAPFQPIVSMPISNSVPTHADPFIISTTFPSQGGNNLDPPFPEPLHHHLGQLRFKGPLGFILQIHHLWIPFPMLLFLQQSWLLHLLVHLSLHLSLQLFRHHSDGQSTTIFFLPLHLLLCQLYTLTLWHLLFPATA